MATRSNGKSGRNGGTRDAAPPAPPADAAKAPDADAELAALLDSEAAGAETPAIAPSSAGPERIPVVPQVVVEDIPAASVSRTAPVSTTGSYLSTLPDRPLPATKRFGAIILDAPVRTVGSELAAGLSDRGTPPGPGKDG